MAWTDPDTLATGTVITAAIWNQHVVNDRDNQYNITQSGGAYASGNVSVSAGANCQFDTSLTDYTGYWDTAANDRLTAVIEGLHRLSVWVGFNGATVLTIKKNGSAYITLPSYQYYANSTMLYLEAGDYVTLACTTARTQSGGGFWYLKLISGGWTDYGTYTLI